MKPSDFYHLQCQQGVISSDPAQLAVMQHFDRVYADLLLLQKKRQHFLSFLLPTVLVKGLYIWGSVGTGKTFMMDCFYRSLPPSICKMRLHFHAFMASVHQALRRHQGEKNPLEAVANDIARQAILLCFDELFVSDITDAMLLGGLFAALFRRGVILITTSNVPPDELYRNGLQRESFLPAIALLKEKTEVVRLALEDDYRLRHLKGAGVFFTPLDAKAEAGMQQNFALLAGNKLVETTPLTIEGRCIRVVRRTQTVVWFEFSDLCRVPRSQQDYLVIAETFRTVMVSNVPVIAPSAKDAICLFVSLIDVLYDARVRLVMSAAEPVADLYNRGFMVMEYTRTHSRLLEMQSTDYFLNYIDK